ncbi:type VI secretion system baseplate subunit TssG [Marinobacterium stanieri]|uniref:type VI secretion system baseplate subunit TssG n=1 Tax=Marinobacterium stanieri TaxID=49186 RepID=UPI003A958C9D
MTAKARLPNTHFFQLLRRLEVDALRVGRNAAPIGRDYPLHSEFAEFRVLQSLDFPHAACVRLEPLQSKGYTKNLLHVACFGLTGPAGVLPVHYTELLKERHRLKDAAFIRLLDGFNARAISFMYRAWRKNRLPLGEEQQLQPGQGQEKGTGHRVLLGYSGLRNESGVSAVSTESEAKALYFSGFFSKRPRHALGLKRIIANALGCAVSIQQFHARWFDLDDDQVHITGQCNSTLGRDFVIGSAVYEGACSIRIRTEPVNLSLFAALQPGKPRFVQLQELVQLYLGQDYYIDLQVVLKGRERPDLVMSGATDTSKAFGLGEGLWLATGPSLVDLEDTVHEVSR